MSIFKNDSCISFLFGKEKNPPKRVLLFLCLTFRSLCQTEKTRAVKALKDDENTVKQSCQHRGDDEHRKSAKTKRKEKGQKTEYHIDLMDDLRAAGGGGNPAPGVLLRGKFFRSIGGQEVFPLPNAKLLIELSLCGGIRPKKGAWGSRRSVSRRETSTSPTKRRIPR